jgi:hypothetical protein
MGIEVGIREPQTQGQDGVNDFNISCLKTADEAASVK